MSHEPKITSVEIRHICGKCGKTQSIRRDRNGNADLNLTSRIFRCRHCGFTFDRTYPQAPGTDHDTVWPVGVPWDR